MEEIILFLSMPAIKTVTQIEFKVVIQVDLSICLLLAQCSLEARPMCGGGGFTPLDDIDFEAVDVNGALRWPITKNELMPSYTKAANLFGIPNLDLFDRSGLPGVKAAFS